MIFNKLSAMTAKVYSAIDQANDDDTDDWGFVDDFLGCLRADIVEASDTLSTLPDSMNPEWPYIREVQRVLRCYSTMLQSGCMLKISEATHEKLKTLVETICLDLGDQKY